MKNMKIYVKMLKKEYQKIIDKIFKIKINCYKQIYFIKLMTDLNFRVISQLIKHKDLK